MDEENPQETQVLAAIQAQMERLSGHVGFYYKNLVTGREFGYQAQETYFAASVIKLPLFLHILTLSAQGKLDMAQKLTVRHEDKVSVCGAVTLFTDEPQVDIRTLCRLMISISDNTATNLLLTLCTLEGANRGFRAMGLDKTRLTRLMFDSQAAAAGLQNTICPAEMGMLLEGLYRNTFVSPAVCQEALDTLRLQQIRHKLNGKLCGAVPIAHKTGEDAGLSNDVGIVFAPEPFLVCFAGHDTEVYAWETVIREGTYDLYQAQRSRQAAGTIAP